MQSSKKLISFAVFVVMVAGVLFVYFSNTKHYSRPEKNSSSVSFSSQESDSSNAPDVIEQAPYQYSSSDIQQAFENSNDLFTLALDLRAKSLYGDAEAQYYLSKILIECTSLSMIIEPTPYDPPNILELKSWFKGRCANFEESYYEDFGDYDHWLKMSSKNNYPPALALELYSNHSLINEINLDALFSDNIKETLWILSHVGRNGKRNEQQEALLLAACDYGLDCSSSSKHYWKALDYAKHCTNHAKKTGYSCTGDDSYLQYISNKYASDQLEIIKREKDKIISFIENKQYHEIRELIENQIMIHGQ
jgi:hypothetical protein